MRLNFNCCPNCGNKVEEEKFEPWSMSCKCKKCHALYEICYSDSMSETPVHYSVECRYDKSGV